MIRIRYVFVIVGGVGLPSKPKKPYAYPGCPALVTGRYCEEHAAKRNREYEKFNRDKNTKRRYARVGLVPIAEIHHKLPLAEGGTHDRSNLIALCKSCHSQKHAKRGNRWYDR